MTSCSEKSENLLVKFRIARTMPHFSLPHWKHFFVSVTGFLWVSWWRWVIFHVSFLSRVRVPKLDLCSNHSLDRSVPSPDLQIFGCSRIPKCYPQMPHRDCINQSWSDKGVPRRICWTLSKYNSTTKENNPHRIRPQKSICKWTGCPTELHPKLGLVSSNISEELCWIGWTAL